VPSCSRCPSAAVLHQRHSGNHLCRQHFLEHFTRRAKAELAKQGRLPEGTVAVALSGGKDSVALLHFLHGLVADHPRLRLVAVTVDEGIAGYRDAAIAICKQVTAELGIEWRTIGTRELAGYSIDEYAAGAKGPRGQPLDGKPRPACGPCGVFRREGMNRLAQEAGAAAVATGHNLDDVAQTLLMNHLKGDIDRLARMAPHDQEQGLQGLQGSDGLPGEGGQGTSRVPGLVPRIMPFRSIPEKEVLLYAVLNGLPVHQADGEGLAECPYAARSHRFAMRDILVQLEERNPGTRHALLRGQERLQPILRAALPIGPTRTCSGCGQPAGSEVCVACSLRA
jgi:uncharacterized protein (TIGR00269 family)